MCIRDSNHSNYANGSDNIYYTQRNEGKFVIVESRAPSGYYGDWMTKTLFYNKNKGLIKGYWRIISPHSVLMTEIRGIFNLPIENSSR